MTSREPYTNGHGWQRGAAERADDSRRDHAFLDHARRAGTPKIEPQQRRCQENSLFPARARKRRYRLESDIRLRHTKDSTGERTCIAVRGAVRAAVDANRAPILEKEASEAILPLRNATQVLQLSLQNVGFLSLHRAQPSKMRTYVSGCD